MNDRVLDLLRQAVGEDSVLDDPDARDLAGQDILHQGGRCLAVLRPKDREALARGIAAATAAGLSLHPRGAGASYSGGYLPPGPGAVVLDLSRLDRIIALDPVNMTVTVEAGVTWKALGAALAAKGLRTPFRGPLSGAISTVGGALSQNAIFWGSGLHGSSADSVMSLQVVLADGRSLWTGSGGAEGAPDALRPYGPDLTGLFLGDCGALGVKAAATLRLLPVAGARLFASFAYPDAPALLAAMSDVARAQLASDNFAMDPFLTGLRLRKSQGLAADLASLWAVIKASGPVAGARLVLAGRRFARDLGFVQHLVFEAFNPSEAAARLAAAQRIAIAAGGRPVEAAVPTVLAADPFPSLRGVLGPGGERWAPIHAVLPHDRAAAFYGRFEAIVEQRRSALDAAGIKVGALALTVGTTAVVIEVMMFWPDARTAAHDALLGPAAAARIPRLPPGPEARALVEDLRTAFLELSAMFNAAHLQIGRTYRFRASRGAEALALLDGLKALVDPRGLMNPGVLGYRSGAAVSRPSGQ